MTEAAAARKLPPALLSLIAGHVGLHACMTGLRLAIPLAALRDGQSPLVVGLLLGLFAAAPVVLALHAGRFADRHGYHRPIRVAVALNLVAVLLALGATWAGAAAAWVYALAAICAGAGTNTGVIAIQRTAGRMAQGSTDLKRIFSWLGLAPAFANVVGPVLAGFLIDAGGFRAAYLALLLLPLPTLWWARQVPREARGAPRDESRGAFDLLQQPGLRRLLLVNWLLASAWDVHTFLVPVLGHERGFSASAIGLILGVFAASVTAVRVVMPWLAHRLHESTVLMGAMLATALLFALYPLVSQAGAMAVLAALLGLFLGSVQPMIMAALHEITPAERHGEAIALRSMVINLSSALMPLAFGVAGAAVGASALFWTMGAAVGAGSVPARRVGHKPVVSS
jgi:MFS family permease